MAHPYESYTSTRSPRIGDVSRIAPSHYLIRGTRSDEFLIKRVFINDGNGRARHYWQTTKVLQTNSPFIESNPINLSATKRETIDHLGFRRKSRK